MLWDDNYFALMPGESRELAVRYPRRHRLWRAQDGGCRMECAQSDSVKIAARFAATLLASASFAFPAPRPRCRRRGRRRLSVQRSAAHGRARRSAWRRALRVAGQGGLLGHGAPRRHRRRPRRGCALRRRARGRRLAAPAPRARRRGPALAQRFFPAQAAHARRERRGRRHRQHNLARRGRRAAAPVRQQARPDEADPGHRRRTRTTPRSRRSASTRTRPRPSSPSRRATPATRTTRTTSPIPRRSTASRAGCAPWTA